MVSKWAFLSGLGAGIALGVAFAPRSGKETRNALDRRAQQSMKEMGATGKKIAAQVKEAAAKGKEQVEQAFQAGKEAYEQQVGT